MTGGTSAGTKHSVSAGAMSAATPSGGSYLTGDAGVGLSAGLDGGGAYGTTVAATTGLSYWAYCP